MTIGFVGVGAGVGLAVGVIEAVAVGLGVGVLVGVVLATAIGPSWRDDSTIPMTTPATSARITITMNMPPATLRSIRGTLRFVSTGRSVLGTNAGIVGRGG